VSGDERLNGWNGFLSALCLALLAVSACSGPARSQEATTILLEIHAATELKSEDDVRIRSEVLGCNPCSQVTLSNGERYLIDPTPMASLNRPQVEFAYVGTSSKSGSDSRYELMLQLSDEGAEKLRKSLPGFPFLVMNSFGGKPLGVSASLPLKGIYSIAAFTSAEGAKGVAAEMGLRVKEIPFDEEAVRRYQQQVDGSEAP